MITICGIAGFSLNPLDNVNAKRLSKAMLLDIESRGKDATGFAFLDSTGKLQIHKQALSASKFIPGRLCMPKRATTVIMHTRWATQGSETNNDNNHPIWQANIAGVHNGHVLNDDEIFAKIKDVAGGDVRIAQVDSEAIFAALGWLDLPVTEVLESLSGNVSCAWLDQDDEVPNRLHVARVDSSPLVILETTNGSMLFASTESAVRSGARAVGLGIKSITHVSEGQYIQVLNGELLKIEKFQPSYRYTYSKPNYGYGRTFDNRSATATSRNYAEWDDDSWDHTLDLHTYMEEARAKRAKAAEVAAAMRKGSTASETLAEKVLREVQEDSDSPDEDDELYQHWLQDNAREIDYKLDKEELEDKRFVEFLQSPRVNTYQISHAEYLVPTPSESEYLAVPNNETREWAIEKWANGVKADDVTKRNAALAMRADVRPGCIVITEMDGRKYDGVVAEVPRTFPMGDYILRLFVPANEKWGGNKPYATEAVLVARQYWQFEVAGPKSTELVVTDDAGKIKGQV